MPIPNPVTPLGTVGTLCHAHPKPSQVTWDSWHTLPCPSQTQLGNLGQLSHFAMPIPTQPRPLGTVGTLCHAHPKPSYATWDSWHTLPCPSQTQPGHLGQLAHFAMPIPNPVRQLGTVVTLCHAHPHPTQATWDSWHTLPCPSQTQLRHLGQLAHFAMPIPTPARPLGTVGTLCHAHPK